MRHLVILAISALAFSGCGGTSYPTSTVQGKVTVDNKPIADGTISITPLSGNRGQGMSTPIREGRYHVEGVPQGRVRVFFNAVRATGKTVLVFDKPEPEYVSLIPDAYRSGVEFDVQGEKMEYDFDLHTQGGPVPTRK